MSIQPCLKQTSTSSQKPQKGAGLTLYPVKSLDFEYIYKLPTTQVFMFSVQETDDVFNGQWAVYEETEAYERLVNSTYTMNLLQLVFREEMSCESD